MSTSKKPHKTRRSHTPAVLEPAILAYRHSGRLVPHVVEIIEADRKAFFAFRRNPARFAESIFDGDWFIPSRHPESGDIRVVAVVEVADGVWVVARQGDGIYAAYSRTC